MRKKIVVGKVVVFAVIVLFIGISFLPSITGNINKPKPDQFTLTISKPENAIYRNNQKLVPFFVPLILRGGIDIEVEISPGDSPLAVSKSVVHSSLAQLQVSGSNRIVNNNIKLNTPQPTPWHHNLVILFGRISNPYYNPSYKRWCFDCEYVTVFIWDDEGCDWGPLTCGQTVCIPKHIGIITYSFVFVLFKLEWIED